MSRVAFGTFVLDMARGGLLRDGRPVPVNHKGISLLATLLRTPGEIVDKATLMDAAWPGMAVEESNLSVQIAALRKLLGAAHDGSGWIATVPRVGYRFAGSVSSADDHGEGVDAAEARPVIAVLPFGIASEQSGKDYLADGITDDIITALARYRWFRVVVRGSAFALRDTSLDADKAAHQLGARYALHGSVRHSAQRLRISAQLIDAKDGTHLWAERYDLALADVFAIQDEIAERVVAAIEPELLKSEFAPRGRTPYRQHDRVGPRPTGHVAFPQSDARGTPHRTRVVPPCLHHRPGPTGGTQLAWSRQRRHHRLRLE